MARMLARCQNNAGKLRKLHWLTPTTIFSCLLTGVLVAVAHHCIYQSLEGTTVASDAQQRWIIRGGTALAFLFKMFLTISTAAAYVQQLWLTLARRPANVGQVEDMFDVLRDVTSFIDLHWFRNPLLALTAIITWAIPISAIIAPGTLIVQLQSQLKSQSLRVPALDMDSLSNKWYYLLDSLADIGYSPNTNVTRVSLSSMVQGAILPMQPQHSNSSYVSQFYGPAIRCRPWDETATKQFQHKYCNNFLANFCPAAHGKSEYEFDYAMGVQAIRYLSWTEDYGNGHTTNTYYNASSPPFVPITVDSTDPYPFDPTSEILHIYVGQQSYASTGLLFDPSPTSFGPDILTTCTFANASYTANFSFTNNIQHTTILDLKYAPLTGVTASGSDPPLARSYMALWAATSPLLIGLMVYNVAISDGLPTGIAQTQISNSALDPLTRTFPSAKAFSQGVEELFHNITLSAFSIAGLTTNSSASPVTAVEVGTYRNVYTYDAGALWKAYGTGIGVALLCALIGLRAMLVNGKTYKNSFSTVLRTTRARDFDRLFTEQKDVDGTEPVPKHITDAVIIYMEDGFRLQRCEEAMEKANVIRVEDDLSLASEPGLQSNSRQVTRNPSNAQTWAKRVNADIISAYGSPHLETVAASSAGHLGSSKKTTEQALPLLIPRKAIARQTL